MLRFLLALVMLPVVAAYAFAAGESLLPLVRHPEPLQPFGIGLATYLAIWLVHGRRRPPGFWFVFRHEMAHAIFCVLMLRKVHSFQAGSRADAEGRIGLVRHEAGGGPAGVLISLAPYFFPTLTALLLVVRPLLQPAYRPMMDGLIGWSFGFHLVSFCRDAGTHQSDIREHGVVFSMVFITLVNLLVTVSTLLLLHGGSEAAARFLAAGPAWLERGGSTLLPLVRQWTAPVPTSPG